MPSGLAVSTVFSGADGDRIGFFIVKSDAGHYRIEDNGLILPTLEASGVDFRSGTRASAMQELLSEYSVMIDKETREFAIENISEDELPSAAMRFVAFSLRVRDFALMTEMRVARSFRDDVKRLLSQASIMSRRFRGNEANRPISPPAFTLEESVPLTEKLKDLPPDFVLRSPERPPVGVFLGTSDTRIWQAIVAHMQIHHELRENYPIVALLERDRSVSAQARQQAMNRLAAVTEFRGDEIRAINRIVEEAIGHTIQ